jgi:regulator of replication initiation timing
MNETEQKYIDEIAELKELIKYYKNENKRYKQENKELKEKIMYDKSMRDWIVSDREMGE